MFKKFDRLIASILTAIIIGLIFVLAANFEYQREIELKKRSVSDSLNVISASLNGLVNSYIFCGNGVKSYIRLNPNFKDEEMTGLVSGLLDSKDKVLRNFSILKDTTIIFTYPRDKNKSAIGKDLSNNLGQKDTVLKVKNNGKTLITGPVKLVQGGDGLIIRMGVNIKTTTGESYWGQVSSVLAYEQITKKLNLANFYKSNNIRIYTKASTGTPHIVWSNHPAPIKNSIVNKIELANDTWIFEAQPKNGWVGTTPIFFLILLLGVLTSIFAGFYLYNMIKKREYLAKIVKEKTNELEASYNELKEAQEQLIEKEKLASLGILVAGIAHEINTPLGISVSIASHLDNINKNGLNHLIEGTLTKTELQKLLEGINESIDMLNSNLYRAADLIGSFKKIAVDQYHVIKSDINIKEYLYAIVTSVAHEIKKAGVNIQVNCPEDLTISSFPGDFSQVFTNLIMNSIHHGFKNRGTGDIKINISRSSNHLNILYSDNGVGIHEDNIKKIFIPFFTTNREAGGSGLGMNVVYNIITVKFKGTIKCESTPGLGTTFKLSIPLERSDEKWITGE